MRKPSLSALAVVLIPLLGSSPRAQCFVQEVWSVDGGTLEEFDEFGSGVAVERDWALVAARFDGQGLSESGFGSVFAFERVAGQWIERDRLTSDAPSLNEFFGASLALSGSTALISGNQAVYFFERTGTNWSLVQKVDFAGFRGLALRGELAVLSGFEEVSVWRRDSSGWAKSGVLVPAGAAAFSFTGPVATDGRQVFVAETRARDLSPKSGVVYVFAEQSGAWREVQRLTASDAGPTDQFGRGLDVADGQLLAVSFQGEAGAGYVFQRAAGHWFEEAKLVPDVETTSPFYVWSSVALRGDLALVGSTGLGPGGRVHTFQRTDSGWVETAPIDAPDAMSHDQFGSSVDLAADGTALVGATYGEGPLVLSTGSAYFFDTGTGAPLFGCPPRVSLSAGGSQSLALVAGPAHAGEWHLLLGSASGTTPGIALPGGLALPLVADGYFAVTLLAPDDGLLHGALGALDGIGHAQAELTWPAGFAPELAGLTLHHAALVLGPSGIRFTSNAVALLLEG